MNRADRDAIIQQATEQFRKQLEKNLPADDATMDQWEDAVNTIGGSVLPDLLERLTNKRAKGSRDNQTACPCGGWARYRRMETKQIVTSLGPIPWIRPYYYCPSCRKGSTPLDAALHLDRGETTTQARDWIAHLAVPLTFAQVRQVLTTLRGISVSASTAERIAVGAGTSLRAAHNKEAQDHYEDRLADKRTGSPRRLYIGADGVMPPLRDRWKKEGLLGDLVCRYGECKIGVV